MKRYLISICCKCGKEMGRKPIAESWGKDTGIKSMMEGNVKSHSVCKPCGIKLYGKLAEGL